MNEYELNKLCARCDALGPLPTAEQIDRLVWWITESIGPADWDHAAYICVTYGITDAYTDLRMRSAEMGMQR